jgi:hypothetical protein
MEPTMEMLKNETDVAFAGVREQDYHRLLGQLVRSGAVLPPAQWGWVFFADQREGAIR